MNERKEGRKEKKLDGRSSIKGESVLNRFGQLGYIRQAYLFHHDGRKYKKQINRKMKKQGC